MATPDIICYQLHKTTSGGVFAGHNPFGYSAPLLMLQVFCISLVTIGLRTMLKPLGVPVMVSQILGGILTGPIVIGRIDSFATTMFPNRSYELLDVYTLFGAIFYLFLIGVQMDLGLLRSGRKAFVIGILVVMLALLLSTTCAIIVSATFKFDVDSAISLVTVAVAESMVSFPVVAYVLSEIKIVHSEFSIVAMSSAMVSTLISFSIVSILTLKFLSSGHLYVMFKLSCMFIIMVVIIVFILRPVVLAMIRQIPAGQTMKEGHMCVIFLCVMVLAYYCRIVGVHMFVGPLIFGLVIPSGPPLGPALLDRLEFFILWMIMPIFYAQHGMMLNFFAINFKKSVAVGFIIFISCTGKFLGALLPSLYYNMSSSDAVLLGLTMNAQGLVELSLFKLLKNFMWIEEESFQIMCMSLFVITGCLVPLVRYLYKSSSKYVLHRRRTIEHAPSNSELRILACVHDQDNVPSIIHLLKASCPTEDSPISVSTIHLVELIGRATPMLVSHKTNPANTATSQRIINVFRRYEETNIGTVSVHPFTMTSSYETMHDNVGMLAFNKRTSLIILPFHKQLATGNINSHSKIMNSKVLDNAPCSVGILVDRGLLGGYKFVLANWLSYNVVVIFLGGVDDREALAYGLRMSKHPKIHLTVIQFVDTAKRALNEINTILDTAALNDFKMKTAYNNRVDHNEEKVVDREGIMNVIESMAGKFELVIIGRRHDKESPLVLGLADCENCTELGTLGDAFISAEYGGRATILVLQQQTNLSHCATLTTTKKLQPESKNSILS